MLSAAAYRQRDRTRASTNGSAGTTLQGTPACGGQVSSRAAVLAGVHEAHRLQRGDVLVTRQTDPGWAPVFCLVSGLVIERGGMLSHGAIIAREFGLPCIVGVANATDAIPHGARITVNADDGICRIEAAA
jgi:pyruvate,water dikinase